MWTTAHFSFRDSSSPGDGVICPVAAPGVGCPSSTSNSSMASSAATSDSAFSDAATIYTTTSNRDRGRGLLHRRRTRGCCGRCGGCCGLGGAYPAGYLQRALLGGGDVITWNVDDALAKLDVAVDYELPRLERGDS